MVDGVEELCQVDVHRNCPASLHVLLLLAAVTQRANLAVRQRC